MFARSLPNVHALPPTRYKPSLHRNITSLATHFQIPQSSDRKLNSKPKSLRFPADLSFQKTTLPQASPFSTSHIMASDDAYMAFLNKANADNSAASTESEQAPRPQAVDDSLNLPASLQEVKVNYVSESDEPFEPVLLRWKGATKGEWPSADDLSSLISPTADISSNISTLDEASFDPRNEYTGILKAVRSATTEDDPDKVDIKIYRVQLGTSKLEYYVLALNSAEGGRIVGMRALSIES
ncbi:hypothetical protein N7466_008127 [Penicillium verhagenii]|uniref:uncharacterized protein n=1 Tax=Penicillium verhagenii TaxID=1562060 RepID=UPI0025450A25|nr:uncharacterized protein N7466_008127 [Penicillium verhagenii]KAJ5923940.1 hypothetical protein N7466_008127 [Penicillium verhagenii]